MLVAISCVAVILLVALRWGHQLSSFFSHESDEIILLTTFGAVLLVAGLAQRLHVSAAIGAFLVGIALSGAMAEKSRRLVALLRDLFAATFFFFFGMQIDPAALPGVMAPAVILGIVSAATKVLTGYQAVRANRGRPPRAPPRRTGSDRPGRILHGDCRPGRRCRAATWTAGRGLRPVAGRVGSGPGKTR